MLRWAITFAAFLLAALAGLCCLGAGAADHEGERKRDPRAMAFVLALAACASVAAYLVSGAYLASTEAPTPEAPEAAPATTMPSRAASAALRRPMTAPA